MRPNAISPTDRFWKKVVKTETCWVWIGALNNRGYGHISIREGPHTYVPYYAHRYSWILHNGPIPDGLCVLHTCDHRWCVNPGHLWLGSNLDNSQDMVKKGRHVAYPRQGVLNPSARLTENDVITIRELVALGQPWTPIATSYGITIDHVGAICRRRCWKHVP